MPRRILPTLHFDDLAVDDEWETPGRTITAADVAAYAGVSGDFNPLHVDHELASAGPFRRPVAHGLLGLAVSSGLASQAPRVEILALLEVVHWAFLRPIGLGDTVRLIHRVEALEPRAGGRRGVVTWRRRLVDSAGSTYQEGLIRTLVRSRGAADASLEDDNPTGNPETAPSE